jgi:hypothetical protein
MGDVVIKFFGASATQPSVAQRLLRNSQTKNPAAPGFFFNFATLTLSVAALKDDRGDAAHSAYSQVRAMVSAC